MKSLTLQEDGTYLFEDLKLTRENYEQFQKSMLEELAKKKYDGKVIRIHLEGDFESTDNLYLWSYIAECHEHNPAYQPLITFYTFTKRVESHQILRNIFTWPSNFFVIYNLGGEQDHLIDLDTDAHTGKFNSYEDVIKANYKVKRK
jgi:hypothetical protein